MKTRAIYSSPFPLYLRKSPTFLFLRHFNVPPIQSDYIKSLADSNKKKTPLILTKRGMVDRTFIDQISQATNPLLIPTQIDNSCTEYQATPS